MMTTWISDEARRRILASVPERTQARRRAQLPDSMERRFMEEQHCDPAAPPPAGVEAALAELNYVFNTDAGHLVRDSKAAVIKAWRMGSVGELVALGGVSDLVECALYQLHRSGADGFYNIDGIGWVRVEVKSSFTKNAQIHAVTALEREPTIYAFLEVAGDIPEPRLRRVRAALWVPPDQSNANARLVETILEHAPWMGWMLVPPNGLGGPYLNYIWTGGAGGLFSYSPKEEDTLPPLWQLRLLVLSLRHVGAQLAHEERALFFRRRDADVTVGRYWGSHDVRSFAAAESALASGSLDVAERRMLVGTQVAVSLSRLVSGARGALEWTDGASFACCILADSAGMGTDGALRLSDAASAALPRDIRRALAAASVAEAGPFEVMVQVFRSGSNSHSTPLRAPWPSRLRRARSVLMLAASRCGASFLPFPSHVLRPKAGVDAGRLGSAVEELGSTAKASISLGSTEAIRAAERMFGRVADARSLLVAVVCVGVYMGLDVSGGHRTPLGLSLAAGKLRRQLAQSPSGDARREG